MKYLIFIVFIFTILYLSADEYFEEEEPVYVPYEFIQPKNPIKAGLLSTFIPGAGQIYNERYVKGGAVILIQSSLVGMTFYYDSKMKEYNRKRKMPDGTIDPYYNYLYGDYFDKRQSYIYWVATSVFISAMEAFVDAHLINFNAKKHEIRLMFDGNRIEFEMRF